MIFLVDGIVILFVLYDYICVHCCVPDVLLTKLCDFQVECTVNMCSLKGALRSKCRGHSYYCLSVLSLALVYYDHMAHGLDWSVYTLCNGLQTVLKPPCYSVCCLLFVLITFLLTFYLTILLLVQ